MTTGASSFHESPSISSSATATIAPSSLTRFQSFRRKHRDKPLKQALFSLGMFAILIGYGYAFFFLQPDRSYDTIITWNAALEYRANQIQNERMERKRLGQAKKESDKETQAAAKDPSSQPQSKNSVDQLAQFLSFLFAYLACRNIIRNCLNSRQNRFAVSESVQDRRRRRIVQWYRLLQRQRPRDVEALEGFMQAELRMEGQEDQQARGATAEQIDACPVRFVAASEVNVDHQSRQQGDNRHSMQCDICLEPYRVADAVRTIPCFHSFHAACIDVWLHQRGACPICTHPV
jgi:hypothetical protein